MVREGTKRMADIEAKIPVLFFKEGKKVIAYSPAFDLSSCGDTEEQARKRFAEAVSLFIDELTSMGTLGEVLEECGWQKASRRRSWAPPVYKSIEEAVKIPV